MCVCGGRLVGEKRVENVGIQMNEGLGEDDL